MTFPASIGGAMLTFFKFRRHLLQRVQGPRGGQGQVVHDIGRQAIGQDLLRPCVVVASYEDNPFEGAGQDRQHRLGSQVLAARIGFSLRLGPPADPAGSAVGVVGEAGRDVAGQSERGGEADVRSEEVDSAGGTAGAGKAARGAGRGGGAGAGGGSGGGVLFFFFGGVGGPPSPRRGEVGGSVAPGGVRSCRGP